MEKSHSIEAIYARETLAWDHIAIIAGVHVAALAGFFWYSKAAFVAFLVMHFLTGCLGTALGLHRLISHGHLKTSPFMRGLLAYLGTLNLQGGPLVWAAFHRSHHLYTDEPGDPHSSKRGFMWSYILWMFHRAPNGFSHLRGRRLIQDLSSSAWLRFLDRNVLFVNVATAAVFFLVFRRLDLLIWAFPVRIVAFWHPTWLVNSYCHRAVFKGERAEPVAIRNSWWISVLTYGEAWHGNHHLRADSASLHFKWWQLDPTYQFIRLFQRTGLGRITRKTRQGTRLGKEFRGKRPAA